MSFGTFDMSPERFAAMAPHLQAEAVLLMAESRVPVSVISASTDLSQATLRAIGRARHGYRRHEPDVAVREATTRPVQPRHLPGSIVLTAAAVNLLRLMRAHKGEIELGYAEIEDQAGIGQGKGKRAIQVLYERGLIYRIKAGMGGKPSIWALTADGAQHGDLLFAAEAAPCCQTL